MVHISNPSGWNASPFTPPALNFQVLIYTCGWRETLWESSVFPCPGLKPDCLNQSLTNYEDTIHLHMLCFRKTSSEGYWINKSTLPGQLSTVLVNFKEILLLPYIEIFVLYVTWKVKHQCTFKNLTNIKFILEQSCPKMFSSCSHGSHWTPPICFRIIFLHCV